MLASLECSPRPDIEPTVFVVDDDVSVRESLEMLIREAGWRPELFASGEAFLAYPRVTAPRCLVLDVRLPDFNGLELQKQIAIDQPYMPIILITGNGDVPMAVDAMRAGAFEFLTKPFGGASLLCALQNAIARSQMDLGEERAFQSLSQRYATLTPRERDVMELVVSGMLNKQIGSSLGISEVTVKAHRGNMMRKMAAKSLADLVKMDARLQTVWESV
jgi:FixJ family two-component response regulator